LARENQLHEKQEVMLRRRILSGKYSQNLLTLYPI